jgi:hypothetical protein
MRAGRAQEAQISVDSRLKMGETSATVPAMSPSRQREVARLRARRRRSENRAARLVLLAILSTALVLTLVLSAFGNGAPAVDPPTPASASRLLPGRTPTPQVVATVGTLQLNLPVAQDAVTAIAYHGARSGALSLSPVGRRGNEGLLGRLWHRIAGDGDASLVWYQLGSDQGPGTQALDVGAAAGTDVYAPVGGTVVGISDYVISNRSYGARIDIRPSDAPSLVVSLTQLRPDPTLSVGSPVVAGASKLGTVVDLAAVERQALARYTQDAGNNVSVEVHPAATVAVP